MRVRVSKQEQHNSLRQRAQIGIIGLTIGPIILIGVVLLGLIYSTQRAQVIEYQHQISENAAHSVEDFFHNLEQQLVFVVDVQLLTNLDIIAQTDIIEHLLVTEKGFQEVYLLDSQGERIIYAHQFQALTGENLQDFSQEEEYRQPISTQQIYYSGIWFDDGTGEPFMKIAVPVVQTPSGQVEGVLVAVVRFNEIWDLVAGIRVGEAGNVYIVDDAGKVIAHRNPEIVTHGTTFKVPEKNGGHSGLSGEGVILASQAVSFGGRVFTVVSERPISEALAPVNRSVLIVVAALIVALLVSQLFRLLFMRQVVERVENLAAVTQKIAAGELARRAKDDGRDEIGALATFFNEMADQLQAMITNLESQVAERTAELSEANALLEEEAEEHRRVDRALRESEERYRSLAEAAHDFIFTIDRDGIVGYVNQFGAAVFDCTPDEMVGKPMESFFPEATYQRQWQGIQHVFESGQSISSQSRVEFPGQDLWLDTILVPLRNNKQEVSVVMGIARDNTQRKLAEEALKDSEERIKALLNALSESALLIDPDGVVIAANTTLAERLDTTLEAVIGQSFYSFFSPSVAEFRKERITKAVQTKKPVTFEDMRSGRTFLNTVYPVVDENGDVESVAILGIDLTERIKMEEALKDSETNLQAIFANSLQAFIVLDSSLTIKAFNKRAFEFALLTYEKDMQVGNSMFDYIFPQDVEGFKESFQKALAGERVRVEINFGDEQQPNWYELFYVPVVGQSGQVEGVFLTSLDINARKQAQQRMTEQAEALGRSNRELEQFAYVASHDLQEPLRMVTSYLQLLQQRYQGSLDEKADKYIYYAVDGATRMKRLINDLLMYSRVGTRSKEFETVDIDEVLQKVFRSLEMVINENEAVISADPLPSVQGDPVQLEQLFQNLINNAIKFRAEAPPQIRISAQKVNAEWQISVSDNGIGIEPQYYERIFDIFQRLHSMQKYSGTGIGLAVCKRIVERHNGRIWLESQPGQGTAFFFTLPVSE